MARKQPFDLIYNPEVTRHLAAIEPKYHSSIRTAIEEQFGLSQRQGPATENIWNGRSTWGRDGSFA